MMSPAPLEDLFNSGFCRPCHWFVTAREVWDKPNGLGIVARQVSRDEGITEKELRSGSRRTRIRRTRRLFSQLSVVKMGYSGAQVAPLLGVSTSAVVRAAHSEELPEVGNYF